MKARAIHEIHALFGTALAAVLSPAESRAPCPGAGTSIALIEPPLSRCSTLERASRLDANSGAIGGTSPVSDEDTGEALAAADRHSGCVADPSPSRRQRLWRDVQTYARRRSGPPPVDHEPIPDQLPESVLDLLRLLGVAMSDA